MKSRSPRSGSKRPAPEHEHSDQCSRCRPAKCCIYVALQVPGPRSHSDFDDMLWHISHRGVEYFVEDGKWFIRFIGRCQHLDKDNRCRIYGKRFEVCRNHPPDNCEFTGPYDFDYHFKTYKQLKDYMEARWERMRRSQRKRRRRKVKR